MKETIIQFGEGNFLRGFVDYFIQKLNDKGLYDGKVAVIKPTNRGNVDKFIAQNCEYNLFLRGLENGEETCEHTKIDIISRIINPYESWQDCLDLAKSQDIRFVVSNTTEAGIVFDDQCRFDDVAPSSFPAKLTRMLFERFNAGLEGLVMLPCELIDNNADELKKCVLEYAKLWNLSNEFVAWINDENQFCNTLVDRIVTGYPADEAEVLCKEIGYEDKLIDTAEIFHLWVIQGNFENELPLKKAGFNVHWTDDVKPFKKMKVRILNGAHTSMVCAGILAGIQTVGECMNDQDVYAFMKKCVYEEILKTIGETEENVAFAKAVEDRFKNPYIKHLLRSIVLNSVSKFSVRVLPTIIEYKEKFGEYPKALSSSLASLIYFYKFDEPNDDIAIMEFMKNATIEEILKNVDLWGCDLTDMLGIIEEGYNKISQVGIREYIKCI